MAQNLAEHRGEEEKEEEAEPRKKQNLHHRGEEKNPIYLGPHRAPTKGSTSGVMGSCDGPMMAL